MSSDSQDQQQKVPYWKLDDKRLGFPLSIEQSIEIDDKKAAQQLQKRVAHKQKWMTWLQSIKNANPQTTYTKNNSTFKKLVRQGVPMELRPQVWLNCSTALVKRATEDNLMLNPNVHKDPIDHDTVQQIDMDIVRTFPQHPFFSKSESQDTMRRILLTYATRNPSVGYSQNLPFIVAIPMLLYNEEEAFWLVATILEELLPKNFGNKTFEGLRVDQRVLAVLIQERLPKLHAHLTKHRLDLTNITTNWLLRLFCDIFPIETTLRIWDCFLNEGSKILFRVMLAFFKLEEANMMKITDIGELTVYLNKQRRSMFDADKLLATCAGFWNLQRKHINNLRAKFAKEVAKEDAESSLTYSS